MCNYLMGLESLLYAKAHIYVPNLWEKIPENEKFLRSGKCQGISFSVGEI